MALRRWLLRLIHLRRHRCAGAGYAADGYAAGWLMAPYCWLPRHDGAAEYLAPRC